jgi:hypothetical protein
LNNWRLTRSFDLLSDGDTNATIRGYAFEVAIWNRNHYEAPGIDFIAKKWTEARKIIRNGERISLRWDSRLHVTNEQLGAIVSGAMHIRFVGEFTYCDDLGTERRSGFCRTYDVEADEFVASENQDREYQD